MNSSFSKIIYRLWLRHRIFSRTITRYPNLGISYLSVRAVISQLLKCVVNAKMKSSDVYISKPTYTKLS